MTDEKSPEDPFVNYIAIDGEKKNFHSESDSDAAHPDDNAPQFTGRAVIIGCLLGTIVCASNLYLGLKTGFSFGAQLFGAIFGFATIKFMSIHFPPLLGGYPFGPKENCTVQTVATASGGLAIIFVSAVPALYQLNLLKTPAEDVSRLLTLTLCASYFGLFFAVPLRKYFVIQRNFAFPTPYASAMTIKALHGGASGAEAGGRKAKWMMGTFTFAVIFRVVASYFPGVLWEWHYFAWVNDAGLKNDVDNWGWKLQFTPAFFASGILSGMNASLSFFGGTVLGYGILGPILIATGLAFGPYYLAMGDAALMATEPTPRYWLLWPAILMMMTASIGELLLNSKGVWDAITGFFKQFRLKRRDNMVGVIGSTDPSSKDAPEHEQVPTLWWAGGVVASVLVTIIVLHFQFDVHPGLSILSVILGFLLAFIGLQSSATTDTNPVSACAKASQLVLGGISRSHGDFTASAQRINLIAGIISAASAGTSVDMVGDLKTGHMVGASPRAQFKGQIVGSFFAIFTSVAFFLLFADVYPCITNENIKCNDFSMPSVAAWKAVTVAMTSDKNSVPLSSGIGAIIFAVLALFMVILQHKLPADKKGWVVNMSAIGLGFLVPGGEYCTAMVIGAIFSVIWIKRSPTSHDDLAFAIASGLIAGEGIGGVIIAILTFAGVGGNLYGLVWGCPWESDGNGGLVQVC